jgi:hypothetical protein
MNSATYIIYGFAYGDNYYYTCPFCEAELKGVSSIWGLSPEGWKEKYKEHCRHKIKILQKQIDYWEE